MEKTERKLSPAQVHGQIGRFMLADGMKIVIDFERSQGSKIWNSLTNLFYLDFFGCYATIPLGYNHPRLTSAETVRRLGRLAGQKPSNSDVYSVEMAEFVDTFGRVAVPGVMKHLFFIEGGALAVENALKIAFDWKVRKNLARGVSGEKGTQVLHFRQAFHGRSGYTLSLTNTADPRKTQYFPKFDWPRVTNPKCKFPLTGENLEQTRESEKQALAEIREAIDERSPDIAALILEPIQGEGGDNHFRPEFHQALRKICDEEEILLIYDEVQTGMGATGRMWAYEHYVRPDIIAFGKKTQVCGVMASERIDEVPENVFRVSSRINSTWGGNLVDMMRCQIYLEIFEEQSILEQVEHRGRFLLKHLEGMAEEFPEVVSNVRGKGLFCALDLPDRESRNQFLKALFAKRVIMLGCGERSIRFRTALDISEADLRLGLEFIHETLREQFPRSAAT